MPFPASATFAAASAALLACLSDVRLDEIRVDASLEHRKGSSRRGGKERQGDKRAGAKPKQQRTARSPRLGYRIGREARFGTFPASFSMRRLGAVKKPCLQCKQEKARFVPEARKCSLGTAAYGSSSVSQ
jgi:hypothetical protein